MLSISNTSSTLAKAARLKKMRLLATGLLVLVAIIFVIARTFESSVPALSWVRAFAEAAMIGALADWFAVVALFRHPLGLPIPHTALIRKNKETIAVSISSFIVENFMTRSVISERLHSLKIAEKAAQWLEQNAATVADTAVKQLPELLPLIDKRAVQTLFRTQLSQWAGKIEIAPLLGKVIPEVLTPARFELLLHEILKFTEQTIQENQPIMIQSIKSEIPIPDQIMGFPLHGIKATISEQIAQKVVEKIENTLREVSSDAEHPIRKGISQRLALFVDDLKHSSDYLEKGEQIKREWLSDAHMQRFSEEIWAGVEAFILADVATPDSQIRTGLTGLIKRVAVALQENQSLRTTLESGLSNLIVELVEKNADTARTVIEETVKGWDADEMSKKLELEMGPDLQFIRLNGTLIGGLVGVVIYALSLFLWGSGH